MHCLCRNQQLFPSFCADAALGVSPLCPFQLITGPASTSTTLLWSHATGLEGPWGLSVYMARGWGGRLSCGGVATVRVMSCLSKCQQWLPPQHPESTGQPLCPQIKVFSPVVAALAPVLCGDTGVSRAGLGHTKRVAGPSATTGAVFNLLSVPCLGGKSLQAHAS